MRRFRPPSPSLGPVDSFERVMDVVDAVWLPGHFFVDPSVKLIWEFVPNAGIPWETYQGHLLQERECRATRPMASWTIRQGGAPLLSIHLDPRERCLHVVRGLLVYAEDVHVHEQSPIRKPLADTLPSPPASGGEGLGVRGAEAPGADAPSSQRWQREKVGSIPLDDFTDLEEVRDELVCLLWQAVVGTSRLPLTSLQAPLPAFTFGQLHYLQREDLGGARENPEALRPLRHWRDFPSVMFRQPLAPRERAKALEFYLRCVPVAEIAEASRAASAPGVVQTGTIAPLLRRMFNDVSLSPYTSFVRNVLLFVDHLVRFEVLTPDDELDFLAHLLRQNYRHLLAYDLVVFHHRGANYPDALLLEEVLPRFAALLNDPKHHSAPRLLALVQGCLMADRYLDHPVPDAPTSPGENRRVLPAMERIPDEQIEQPHLRQRRLFPDWNVGTLHAHLLRAAVAFLKEPRHFLELGVAVFIDRPFGVHKQPVEPDQTLLLAHEAFSLTLANGQLLRWRRLLEAQGVEVNDKERRLLLPRLADEVQIVGVPIASAAAAERPGPSLADAQRVAPDFVVLRTLPGSVTAFRDCFAESLGAVEDADWWRGNVVIGRFKTEGGRAIVVFDAQMRPRWQPEVDAAKGYRSRAGLEFPRRGLTGGGGATP